VADRLLDSAPSDAVDSLLRELRVSSTVLCRSRLTAPWGFGVKAHGRAAFHIVTSGTCWLEVDRERERRPLRPGDLVILPRGDAHWLRDEPGSPTVWLDDLLVQDPVAPDRRLRSGGGGPATELLCGVFTLEGNGHHPVLSALPAVIRVRGEGDRPVPWLEATLDLVAAEIDTPGTGAAAMLERISELLVGQALRTTLLDPEDGGDPKLGAFHDRDLSAAMRAIHEHPERSWTVGELAGLCLMSRSAFAARFRALTGESPIRYATRCRLTRAAGQLRTTGAPLGEIAREAGYESAFSFSRAFKRAFGLPPLAYRRGDR
jgi:AraC-like DNA-binding protein